MPDSTTSSRVPAQPLPDSVAPYVPRPLPYDETWFSRPEPRRHRARRRLPVLLPLEYLSLAASGVLIGAGRAVPAEVALGAAAVVATVSAIARRRRRTDPQTRTFT